MSGSRRTRRAPDAALERRYRRLLAWYPAPYLAANGEEMLGVVMSGAAPDQSRPDRGEAISLVASGIRMHFGRMLTGARTPAWRDAGAAFALLGAMLLTAVYAQALAGRRVRPRHTRGRTPLAARPSGRQDDGLVPDREVH